MADMEEKAEDIVETCMDDARETENQQETDTLSDATEACATEADTTEADTTEACTTDSDVKEETEEKKKVFGKKEKKEKKDKKDERIEELTDQVKRQMAEFDNFRKRTDKEKTSMYEMGAKSVIEKILPVLDNFERGLQTVPEEEKESPFASGMSMIYKQLVSELEQIGVKPIETDGREFDPNFHNAVMQVENEELESGMIAQELQKGYLYRDSVVRHSMVSVVQ